jgi:hypothetical protein
MSQTAIAAGDRQMERISGELGISDAGREWLTAALDPYHDTALRICGYPDIEESPSVVQVVKSSFDLVKPAAAGSGNWDCHISSFPWLTTSGLLPLTSTPQANNGAIHWDPTIGLNGTLGGVMVDSVPSTTPTFQMNDTGSATFFSLDGTALGTPNGINRQYAIGEWRQIAHGFEVINTTSELNIQGLVTAYAAPFPQRNSKSVLGLDAATIAASTPPILTTGDVMVLEASMPPTNVAQAMLLPGTRQWKAKEGAYIVPRMNNQDLAVGIDNTGVYLHSNTDPVSQDFIVGVSLRNYNVPSTGTPLFAVLAATNTNMYTTDFNFGGAYFTGLSNSTTLTVNIIRTFERFPSVQLASDAQLVVLASPSPKYDPQAMEAYSVASARMPVGVPQRMNGLGDWFREAVQEIRNTVAPALAAIPHPFAQGLAGAMRVGGSIADSMSRPAPAPAAPAPAAMPAPGRVYDSTGANARRARPAQAGSVSSALRALKVRSKAKTRKTPPKAQAAPAA